MIVMPGAETLLVNAKVFQPNNAEGKAQEATFATSLLIAADGTIRHIGTGHDDDDNDDDDDKDKDLIIQQARANGAVVHDLGGKTVLPGFFDGHIHLLLLGLSLQKVDLAACQSLDDIRATIRAYAEAHPPDEGDGDKDKDGHNAGAHPRIMCKNWMPNNMTPGLVVTHSLLDDLDPYGRPIFVDSRDLHATWCNQAGIDVLDAGLGIGTMPDPPGGTIHRDADGLPTGLFEEAVVFTLIWPWVSRISTLPERAAAVERAVATYSAEGYVGMVDMAMNDDLWDALLLLRAQQPQDRPLPVRIAAYWLLRPTDDLDDLARQVDYAIAKARAYSAETSPDCKVVGIKIVSDGIVDACTAALSEPYTHSGTNADPVWTKAMLRPTLARANAAGLQVAIHAIGDLAIRNAIDTIEAVVDAPALRPRIEHLELASPADAARLGPLGITASVQPVHADPAILRAWPRLLGPHRCTRAFAYREFADGGAPLALGSDAPSAPHSLPANVYVATTRRSAREPALETVVNGHFALGLCESIVAGTAGSAYSCFMDKTTGRIAKGLQADLAVVDMRWDQETLLEAKVCQTWFAGRKVFDAGV